MKKHLVIFSPRARKQFLKAPFEIQESVKIWTTAVTEKSLGEVRRLGGKGLHDEPLKGTLKGLRSIRLNRAWRLYYFEKENEETVIVKIQRIDKHVY